MEIAARFDHFNFNVTDIERSIKFYHEALNLTEDHRMTAGDGSYVIVYLKDNSGNFLLELTWLKEHPQKYDLGECEFHLCLRVKNDYAAMREFHKKMDIVCFDNTEMGLYFIEDPDGYWIEILPEK